MVCPVNCLVRPLICLCDRYCVPYFSAVTADVFLKGVREGDPGGLTGRNKSEKLDTFPDEGRTLSATSKRTLLDIRCSCVTW